MSSYEDYGAEPRPNPFSPNNPRRATPTASAIDPVTAAYQAGRVDAEAERFGLGHASRRHGYVETGYRPVPRGPPIYPARGIRRASTLPVRFDDEVADDVARLARYEARQRRLQPRENATVVVERGRRRSVNSLTSSDSETEQRARRKERLVDIVTTIESLVVEEGENVVPPRPTSRVGRPRSRSPSPEVVIAEEHERPSEEEEAEEARSESPFPKEGKTRIPAKIVSQRAIIELGYPFEEEGDTVIILKALGRENIDELLRLSEYYGFSHTRERVIERDGNGSRSRSRSHSPVRDSRYEETYSRRDRRSNRRVYDNNVESEQEAYSFRLSRHKKSFMSRDSTGGSLSDCSEKDSLSPSHAPAVNPQMGKVLQVSRSHYTGDGAIGGYQSAELKVMEDSGHELRKGSQSLFKWVQFEDNSMNFDRFENVAGSIACLTESQKLGITKLFGRIRRKFDKPLHTSDGSKLRYMTPSILHEPIPREARGKPLKPGTVVWMCLPYFLLQKYSGTFSGSPPASHPMRTLLQTRFSLTRKERDLQQAVCQLAGSPPDHCFHIAQSWCLVIDDAFLITYSRTSISSLMGKSISVSPEFHSPDQTRNRRRSPTHLLVSSGNLLWSFPLNECQTWFAFLTHFWEFLPSRLQFSSGKLIITPDQWRNVLAQASKNTIRLSMSEVRQGIKEPRGTLLYSHISLVDDIAHEPDAAHSGEQNKESTSSSSLKVPSPEASNSQAPSSSSDTPGIGSSATLHPNSAKENIENITKKPGPDRANDNLSNNFHVFAWLNEVQPNTLRTPKPINSIPDQIFDDDTGKINARAFTLDEMNLRADLKEMDRFLKRQTSFEDRLAYQECPQKCRRDVYSLLKKEEKDISKVAEKDLRRNKIYEDKVEILNKAETVFRFFLPSAFEGRTIEKFWGALHRLLVSLSPGNPEDNKLSRPSRRVSRERDPFEVLQWLSHTIRTTQFFAEILSQANNTERTEIDLPEEFSKSWLHFLMALIFCSQEPYTVAFDEQNRLCSQLLNAGMVQVLMNLKQKSLLKYAVFNPWQLASLINLVLLGDITAEAPDTSDTYSEYLSYLESAIESNPLNRGHQDKLTAFKQEISVIQETLMQQRLILEYAQGVSSIFQASEMHPVVQYGTQSTSHYVPARSSALRVEPTYGSSPRERSTRESRLDANYGSVYPAPNEAPLEYYEQRPAISSSRPRAFEARAPPTTTARSQIDPTDPSGIQALLILDSCALIDRKYREFQEMNDRASELEVWNTLKIDYNKDRQEAAIYAFTIVTIIFLPLSTVAGILGMNTFDVRNMGVNQWVFWATALPLTVIIIALCLIWAGELENFWIGFRNLWSGNKRNIARAQYSMLNGKSDTYSTLDPRTEPGRIVRPQPRIVNNRTEYEDVERYRLIYGRNRSRTYDEDGW